MKARRISTIIGTKSERAAVHAQRASDRRAGMLAKLTPAQRGKALDQEAKFKASSAAKAKSEQDDKTRRTVGKVGTKEESEAFQAEKQNLRREDMLAKMTPEQKEKALAQESQAKANEAAKDKAEQDDKTRRTVGKVGSKEEREAFQAEKQNLRREDKLKSMTPEQREKALAQEAEAKAAAAAKAKREQDDKTRRTVGKVGSKEEREAFQAEKQNLRREDMLAEMSPEQQEAALKQEAAFKAKEAAQEQREAQAKEDRTVAIVGDKARRDAFGSPTPPRGTPTVMTSPRVAMSETKLGNELANLNASIALLA